MKLFFRKKAFSLMAVVLACLLLAQPAFAAVSIGEVTVGVNNSDSAAGGIPAQGGQELRVYSNSVSIEVYAPGAEAVKVGNIVATKVDSGDTFKVDDYRLNPGRNNISITASAGGGAAQFKFTIYYHDSAVPGASYKVDRLPASEK